MTLKEFIEKYCYKDVSIKVRGISNNVNSIAFLMFEGYDYDIVSETEIFSLIENMEVYGCKVENDTLVIMIDDTI